MQRTDVKKTCLIIAACCCMCHAASGQNRVPEQLQDDMELMMSDDVETGWEEKLEELEHRREQPLNLNAATKQELEQFPFLSDTQIENLLAYVYTHGQMQSLYELALVDGMNKRTIDMLLPYVCTASVKEPDRFPAMRDVLKHGRHEVLTRLDQPFYTRKGYTTKYYGTKQYHSARYQFSLGDRIQAGLNGEKDAGEPLFGEFNGNGYDHYSFYFIARGIGRMNTLAVGNYRLSYGQGLVLNNGFGLGKVFSLSSLEYRPEGIKKHTSTDEYNYFSGIAASLSLMKHVNLSTFYSRRNMDGAISDDGLITSISKTGLHRTRTEADRKNAFTMQMAGGNLSYEKDHLKVGMTGIAYAFSNDYEPRQSKYQRYNLRGNDFYNMSIDYRLRLGRLLLTGEEATGKSGYALLNRVEYSIRGDSKLMLLHRYYTHDYWSFFAHAFSESTTPQNENGWYLAGEGVLSEHWRVFASADLFAFPWWKYRTSKSSYGFDGMLQTTYTPSRSLSMYVNYRYKRKERDITGTGGEITLPTNHHKLRYRLTYSMTDCWLLRTTADYNIFRQQHDSKGYLLTGMLSYRPRQLPLRASVQGSYFHTDDYDSRVYAYEQGMLYTFSVPSYYGCGYRLSAHLRYDCGKWLMLIAKLGRTTYNDRESISSGNDLIWGNHKTDLQLQMRLKF